MLAAFGGQPQPVQVVSRRSSTVRSNSAPAPPVHYVPPSPRGPSPDPYRAAPHPTPAAPVPTPAAARETPAAQPPLPLSQHYTRGGVRDKNTTVSKLPFDNPIERQQVLQQGGYIKQEGFVPFPSKKRLPEKQEVIFGKHSARTSGDAVAADVAFTTHEADRLRHKQRFGASQRFADSGKILLGELAHPDLGSDGSLHVLRVGGKPKKFAPHPSYDPSRRRVSGLSVDGAGLAPRAEPRKNGIRVYSVTDNRDLLKFDSRSNETVVVPAAMPPTPRDRDGYGYSYSAAGSPRSPRSYDYRPGATTALLQCPPDATTPLEVDQRRKDRKERENSFHQRLIREGYPRGRETEPRNRGLRHITTDDHITSVFDYEVPQPMRVEPRDFFTSKRAVQPAVPPQQSQPGVPMPVLAAKPPLAVRRPQTARGLRTGYSHSQSTPDILCPSAQEPVAAPREGRARHRSQSQPPPDSRRDAPALAPAERTAPTARTHAQPQRRSSTIARSLEF